MKKAIVCFSVVVAAVAMTGCGGLSEVSTTLKDKIPATFDVPSREVEAANNDAFEDFINGVNSEAATQEAEVSVTESNVGTTTQSQEVVTEEGVKQALKNMVTTTENIETVDYTNLTFEDLSKFSFQFQSGAGDWSTDFVIEKDGYFHGKYMDTDWGDASKEYPNGKIYLNVFDGKFEDLKKLDDFTYEMSVKEVNYRYTPETEEINQFEGVKYIYSEANGISGTKKFRIHIPGKSIFDISNEVNAWIALANTGGTELSLLCLENVDQKQGIASTARLVKAGQAQNIYKKYRGEYDSANKSARKANSTFSQEQEKQKASDSAEICLKELWTLLKYNTDSATFDSMSEAQNVWMSERDASGEDKAFLTMERCGELLKLLVQ